MASPDICPNCGEPVPPRSVACPQCGADEQTGWSDQATLERLGVPSQEFDYQEYLKEEFASKPSRARPRGISFLWWAVAILLLWILLQGLFAAGTSHLENGRAAWIGACTGPRTYRLMSPARAHGMRTDQPRQGRKAATAVCSASAVVTLAFFFTTD